MKDMRIRSVPLSARLRLASEAKARDMTIGELLNALTSDRPPTGCPWPGCTHTHEWHVAKRAAAQKGKPRG